MIKVLIVDDNADVRKGLTTLINGEPDMTVASVAENGVSALTLLEKDPAIDVALIDFNMPSMDGVELTTRIRTTNHSVRIAILTMHRQPIYRDEALEAGAKGYLLKGEEIEELFAGIRTVYAGEIFVSPSFDIWVILAAVGMPLVAFIVVAILKPGKKTASWLNNEATSE